MTVKEFITNHKTELILAGIGVMSIAAGVVFSMSSKSVKSTLDKEFADTLRKAVKDATTYGYADHDTVIEMLGKDVVRSTLSGEAMKLTGVIFFGNKL
jgi:hypothetical protein